MLYEVITVVALPEPFAVQEAMDVAEVVAGVDDAVATVLALDHMRILPSMLAAAATGAFDARLFRIFYRARRNYRNNFV